MNDVEQRWWLGRMCKCDHRFGDHRASTAPLPLGCAHAGCGCRHFDPLNPDESPPTMNDETPQPVAHEDSPVLVDEVESAKALIDRASRAAVEAYRAKVLEAFKAWDMRPSDTRTWHQVVMGVELP